MLRRLTRFKPFAPAALIACFGYAQHAVGAEADSRNACEGLAALDTAGFRVDSAE